MKRYADNFQVLVSSPVSSREKVAGVTAISSRQPPAGIIIPAVAKAMYSVLKFIVLNFIDLISHTVGYHTSYRLPGKVIGIGKRK